MASPMLLLLATVLLLPLAWAGPVQTNNSSKKAVKPIKDLTRDSDLSISYNTAVKLAEQPLKCIKQEYPHWSSRRYSSPADLVVPSVAHPIFYGCINWNSAVHGHWLLATMANRFPDTELAKQVEDIFDQKFMPENVAAEMKILDTNTDFGRTYGWSWLLKLHDELRKNPSDASKGWSTALMPIKELLVGRFLNSMGGEDPLALMLTLDHAKETNDTRLADQIRKVAMAKFTKDTDCPLYFEPDGNDFRSPCLMEADVMARVTHNNYTRWLKEFLPGVFAPEFHLEKFVRTSFHYGHQAPLDGLNFSRAWNLYSLAYLLPAEEEELRRRLFALGDEHVRGSIEAIGGDHLREHWLASFLLLALEKRELALKSDPELVDFQ